MVTLIERLLDRHAHQAAASSYSFVRFMSVD